MTKTRLVIIGGGAAGVLIAMKLSNAMKELDLEITLIDSKTFYEYTPALCAVVFAKTEQDCRDHFYKVTSEYSSLLQKYKIKFELGIVEDIQDSKVLLSSGQVIGFDYAVITTGSTYADPWKTKNQSEFLDLKKRLDYILEQRTRYLSAKDILCIGGGPVGVETAAEIAYHSNNQKKNSSNIVKKNVTIVDMGEVVLANAPDGLGKHAQTILQETLSIRVINGEKAEFKHDLDQSRKLYETDKSHTQIEADLVYNCIGAKPNSQFLEKSNSSWLNEKKEIDVDDTFLVKNTENIFAIGDVASLKEAKMFFTTHMQAIHFVKNIKILIKSQREEDMVPYKGCMIPMVISLGPERAIAYVGGITFTGFNKNKGSRIASFIKFMIERITMNDFYLKLPANQVLYLLHEKGQFIPRVINKFNN